MKPINKTRVSFYLIGFLLLPIIGYSANQDNTTGPQDRIKVTDERHAIDGDFFYLNIPEGGILLPGSVVIKDVVTDKVYKEGQNYIAYNAHAEESGFTNSIWVAMPSGVGRAIEPIPQGTEVLVSYEYLLKGGKPQGLTGENVLKRVAVNFSHVKDMQASLEITSTIDGEPTGPARNNKYIFLSPDKIKIETYNESGDKIGVNIIKGSELYLINALGKYQKVNLLKVGEISAANFNQMDFMGNLDEFITAHDITLEEDIEAEDNISVISVVPKEPTPLYTRIELYIDRGMGVIKKMVSYQDSKKIQEIGFSDYQWKNPFWIASKVVYKPILEKGEYITVVNFKDIKINQDVSESEFDPEAVSQEF